MEPKKYNFLEIIKQGPPFALMSSVIRLLKDAQAVIASSRLMEMSYRLIERLIKRSNCAIKNRVGLDSKRAPPPQVAEGVKVLGA